MAKGEWTALIIAGEVILVALVLAVVMVMLLRRSRQLSARLEAQVELLSRRQAGHFLEREMANTREMIKRASPDKEQLLLLANARLHWLQLELRAMREEGGGRSDTVLLESAGRALMAQFAAPAASETRNRQLPSATSDAQQSDDALKQARAVIALQKEIISRLKEKLAATPTRSDDPDRENVGTATLDQVGANADEQLVSVAKLESELQIARASYQQVSDQLALLQTPAQGRASGSLGSGLLIVSSEEGDPTVDVAAARTLLNNMQTAYDESVAELRRMRDTNARQRELIVGMEHELTLLRKEFGETDAAQALLDNLKQQLRDYENCTVILEIESDNLRARIGTLNSIIDNAESGGTLDSSNSQQPDKSEVEALRLRARLFVAALKRLADLANASSMEQAIELLSSGFGDRRLRFVLMVKGASKQYWFSSDGGSVDDRLRHLLLSVVPSTESPWTSIKGGAVFGGSTMRLYMQSGATSDDSFERTLQFLVPQLMVVNTLLAMIDLRSAQPQKVRAGGSRELSGQLDGIAAQQAQLSDESARIGENLQRELERYFTSLALTDIQRECIESMLADFHAEMALITTTSKSIATTLRSTIQTLSGANI